MLLGSLFLNILACTKEVYRKRTRWASRTKSRSRSQNVSGLALYRRRIPNPVSTSYNIYTMKNCHILVKNSWLLILCFVEGNKFIGFIITVTCLPSLKNDVTLPYLNSPWISAIYMRAIQAIFLNDVRSYCEGRKMKRYINVNIKISNNLCSKFWNLGLKIFSIFFSIPKSNFSDAIRSSTKFSYKVLQLILLQSAMVCHYPVSIFESLGLSTLIHFFRAVYAENFQVTMSMGRRRRSRNMKRYFVLLR